MSLFKKSNGLLNVIRCDEPDYLIWKWHPEGTQAGDNGREYAVRFGSALHVKEGEVAVFVYKQKDGTLMDYIVGPYDGFISTKNLPVLTDILGLAYNGDSPFQAEIYFINAAKIVQVRFGVPFFDVYDPRYSDFGVPVAVRGTLSFKIDDYVNFIKLHQMKNFSSDDFLRQIKDAISRYVKDAVANAPANNNIPVIQLERSIGQINDVAEDYLRKRLKDDFGVTVSGADIGAIELDKDSDGYHQLMEVSRELSKERLKAENEDYIERLRIQREEGQYAQHKQTQSANIGAFQTEKQAEVGIAGAKALGQMGENGAGNVNLGDGSGGLNMASMMASMAVGGAVGQNIAGAMNNMMGGLNQQAQAGVTPPPVPDSLYYVAVSGKSTGPFSIAALSSMAGVGQLLPESLVWKNGMTEWKAAGTIDELKSLFTQDPSTPPIPEV